MKKIIWTYGLLSGTFITLFMLISMYYCYQQTEMSGNMILGFSSMILAFSLMFVAIKKYRNESLGGSISFGKAFAIAISIAAIASTMYVIGWIIEFHTLMPDFMERYLNFSLQELENSGKSAEIIASEKEAIEQYRHSYDTLPGMILVTYLEIFPLGLIMALLAALVMKRPPKN
jgi:hypothetical protein